MKLLFDSFLLFEGTRATGAGPRRMLYRADPYQIDLQVEMSSDQSTLMITGQVLDSKQSGFSGRDVVVVISNLRGQVVLTMADQFGEFRKEIPDSDNLELFFLGLTDHPSTIAVGMRSDDNLKRNALVTFATQGLTAGVVRKPNEPQLANGRCKSRTVARISVVQTSNPK